MGSDREGRTRLDKLFKRSLDALHLGSARDPAVPLRSAFNSKMNANRETILIYLGHPWRLLDSRWMEVLKSCENQHSEDANWYVNTNFVPFQEELLFASASVIMFDIPNVVSSFARQTFLSSAPWELKFFSLLTLMLFDKFPFSSASPNNDFSASTAVRREKSKFDPHWWVFEAGFSLEYGFSNNILCSRLGIDF